ncbi:LysO family transporter, partial [Vibrio sp.]|uniref:LysO family transporter n=1 Tax=Vibrio sp. TaxID=678 RepID=UPI003D0BA33B
MFSGMIFIFAPLVVGYLISIANQSWLDRINRTTSQLIYVILCLMGLSLAALDNLGENLQTIIKYVAVFFTCLGGCNLAVLPLVDKWLPVKTDDKQHAFPLSAMAMESLRLILVVGAGLLAGLLLPMPLGWVDSASEWILFVLLFFIGIQLRNSGLTLRQILVNKHGMVIALVIIASSMLGGLLAAWILDIAP